MLMSSIILCRTHLRYVKVIPLTQNIPHQGFVGVPPLSAFHFRGGVMLFAQLFFPILIAGLLGLVSCTVRRLVMA